MVKEKQKVICHVCGKEKKPYVVLITDDIFSYLQYKQAREDGEICQRCDQYYAMTGEFKDATEEEFELAKKSCEFARNMLKWWEKDKKLDADGESLRAWEGTALISRWFRETNQKGVELK